MKGKLILLDDGWQLEDAEETAVDSGRYPLREDPAFIEAAAESLDFWQYHDKPYVRVDERSNHTEA